MCKKENLLTFYCGNKECKARIRIGRRVDVPVLNVGALSFCPLCGGKGMTMHDVEENIWEILAEEYDLKPESVHTLFDIWPREKYVRFADFIQYIRDRVDAA